MLELEQARQSMLVLAGESTIPAIVTLASEVTVDAGGELWVTEIERNDSWLVLDPGLQPTVYSWKAVLDQLPGYEDESDDLYDPPAAITDWGRHEMGDELPESVASQLALLGLMEYDDILGVYVIRARYLAYVMWLILEKYGVILFKGTW